MPEIPLVEKRICRGNKAQSGFNGCEGPRALQHLIKAPIGLSALRPVGPLSADPELAPKQPAYAEHIDRGAQGSIPKMVFAHARLTRPMVNGDFSDLVPQTLYQRWDKSVHSMKWKQRFAAFPPHRLEGAAGIAYTILCKSASYLVCYHTLSTFEPAVFAIEAISTNQIKSFLDLRE